jgi:hypothetical protein
MEGVIDGVGDSVEDISGRLFPLRTVGFQQAHFLRLVMLVAKAFTPRLASYAFIIAV